jgi:hypothetical protein
MSSKLKAITTKAKQLYKTGKFAKWTDAIKEASKHLSKGKKVSGVKKAVKKKAIKKATKKKTVKKAIPKNLHKDTKSHNVRISVVSGINGALQHLNSLIKEKEKAENSIISLKHRIKTSGNNDEKKHAKFWLKRYNKFLSGLKKQITEAKKHI